MNRREFCRNTTLSTVAVGLATTTLPANEARKRLNKGRVYKSVKYGGRVNVDRLRKLKDLGFDGVEGSAPGMDTEGLRKACDEVGLPMHGVVYNRQGLRG
jgi:hypothetical protein